VMNLHRLWEQYLPTLKKKMRMPFWNDYSGHSAHACSAVWDILYSSLQAYHGWNLSSWSLKYSMNLPLTHWYHSYSWQWHHRSSQACSYISMTSTKWVGKHNKQ
jgi:hypothetical protein